MTILIPDYKLPSLNQVYSIPHWTKRKRIVDEAHQLVAAYCPRKIINYPVTIKIVAFYKDKRRRDPDNVFAKGLIDGLKGIAIEDDDSRFVKEVTLQVFTGQKDDHVEMTLGRWADQSSGALP